MAAWLAPAIGAISNTASTIIGNAGARRNQRKANAQNVKFWHMQNAYNDPAAQMERLRSAGLNPNQIYGTSPTSAVGNADSVSPSKAPNFTPPNPLNDILKYSNIGVKGAQTDNLKEQNILIANQAAQTAAQTALLGIKKGQSNLDFQKSKELYDISVDASKEQLRQLQLGTIGKQFDNELKDQTIKSKVEKIAQEAINAKKIGKGQDLTNKLRELETQLKRIGVENAPWFVRMLTKGGQALNLEKLFSQLIFKQ